MLFAKNQKGQALLEALVASTLAFSGITAVLGLILFLSLQTIVRAQLRQYLLCEVKLQSDSQLCRRIHLQKIKATLPHLDAELRYQKRFSQAEAFAVIHWNQHIHFRVQEFIDLENYQFAK